MRDLELVRERLAPGPEGSAALAAGSLVPRAPAEPLPGALSCALEEAALEAAEVLALYAFDAALGEGERHRLVSARLDPLRPEGERRRALGELTAAPAGPREKRSGGLTSIQQVKGGALTP